MDCTADPLHRQYYGLHSEQTQTGLHLDFCASFVAMLAVSCWDINSPLRFPAGTTRMQVTAMDTADDKNTYNAATAHITVPQHSSTLSARAPLLCSLQGWIDRVGSRRVPWVVWSTYICLGWRAQTPANQSRLLLGTCTNQPEGAPAADWVLLVPTGWRWALSRVALRGHQSTSEMCSQGCPVRSRRKWPLAKLDHILC